MHTKSKKSVLAILLCLPLLCAVLFTAHGKRAYAMENYTVTTSERKQTVDGWGTSLIWWAGQVGAYDWKGDDGREVREQIMDLIYGKDGLEYTVARYNVGGGENPDCEHGDHMGQGRKMEGYKKTADGDYDWDADAAQRWTLEWIYENVEDPIVEYFSNSPPWYMTRSKCASGYAENRSNPGAATTNMEGEENYEAFAKYFVDVLVHLVEEEGYRFDYVNPFNESSTGWWPQGGSQEGCDFTHDGRASVLYYMAREMDKHASLDGILISFDDAAGPGLAANDYNELVKRMNEDPQKYESVRARIAKLNYHLYADPSQGRQEEVASLAERDGIKNWMSEIGWNENDNADDVPMDTAFKHSRYIRQTFNAGAEAYILWQIVEELSSSFGNANNYGPIKVSYNENANIGNYGYGIGSYTVDKQYYILGQYSKYIKAGYSIVPTSDGNGVAALSPDGAEVVIVHENNAASSQVINYTLDGSVITGGKKIVTDKTQNWQSTTIAAAGSSFHASVSPYSVTTFVLKTEQKSATKKMVNIRARSKVSGNTLADLPSVQQIAQNGAYNYFYVTGQWGDDGNTAYSATGGAVVVKVHGTGVDLRIRPKSSTAADASYANVWLYDKEGNVLEQCRSLATRGSGDHISLYEIKDLPEDDYIVVAEVGAPDATATSSNGYMNIRGIYVYSGSDTRGVDPLLGGASVIDGNLYVAYDPEPGRQYYVQYREWEGEWVRVSPDRNGPVATGLTADRYEVKLIDGGRASEAVEVRNVKRIENLLYYVDAGAPSGSEYTVYENAGQYQTLKDQAFGADAFTGKSWGRTSVGNKAYHNGAVGSLRRAVHDGVSADGPDAIEYAFEVEAGKTYDMVLGMSNPWTDRDAVITVNGEAKGTFTAAMNVENYVFLQSLSPAESNGKQLITVRVTRKSGDAASNNPVLGLIAVSEHGKPAVFMATGAQMQTVTADEEHNAVLMRPGSYVSPYTQTIALTEAYIYNTDGTCEKKSAQFDDFTVRAASGTTIATVTGTVDGLPFASKLMLEQEKKNYYFIDCGSDGTNIEAAMPGVLQNDVFDRKAPNGTEWGFVGNSGTSWADGDYRTSIRNDMKDNPAYRLTGLPTDREITVEVAGYVGSTWGDRACDVFLSTRQTSGGTKIGTLQMTGNSRMNVLSATVTATDSTMYLRFVRTSGGDPAVSFVRVYDADALDAPVKPTVDREEAGMDDTLRISNLTAGDVLVLTDGNGKYIGTVPVTGSVMDLSLRDYADALYDSFVVQIAARRLGALEDSEAALVRLPGVEPYMVYEKWSDSHVVRFTPSMGVTINNLVIVSPDGKRTDVTDREYYYYVADQAGEYTSEVTTPQNRTYARKFTLDNLRQIAFTVTRSESGWTTQDVTVRVKVHYSVGGNNISSLKSLTVNGTLITPDANDTYTFVADKNATYTFRAVNIFDEEFVEVVQVANIDKEETKYLFTPDLTYIDGFRANMTSGNISGGTFVVKKGEQTVASANGFRILDAGDYDIRYTSGLGVSRDFTFSLAYDPGAVKSFTAMCADNTLVVMDDDVTVYRLGDGEKLEKANRYELQNGNVYLAYKEGQDSYEALIVFTDEASPVLPAEEKPSSDKKGCGSHAAATAALPAAALLLAACLLLKVKGGKRA